MSFARRLALVLGLTALLCAAAYGVGWTLRPSEGRASATDPAAAPADRPADRPAAQTAAPTPTPTPESTPTPEPTPKPTPKPKPSPKPTPEPTPEPEPELRPGPALLSPGDDGPEVRELQARLKQIAWFSGDVTDHFGPITEEAVRGFQAKREIPVTGDVDQRTLDRLHAMTHEPSEAELTNAVTPMGNVPGALDPRCTTGRVLCIDKSSRTLRWVVDGAVQRTLDVRFGASYSPTREGLFHVTRMDADHVSTLYGSAMPYSMFFSGGQAVHYSSDFASRGYAGASHGCVNVRDHDGLAALFGQVHVGDAVVVYWS